MQSFLFVSYLRQFSKCGCGQVNTAFTEFAAKSSNTVLQEADGEKQPEIQSFAKHPALHEHFTTNANCVTVQQFCSALLMQHLVYKEIKT